MANAKTAANRISQFFGVVGRTDWMQDDTTMVWQVPGVIEDLILDLSALSPEMQKRLMFHGAGQKVKDSAAIPYKRPDGSFRPPTAREKFAAMAGVVENLVLGNWASEREAAGGFLFRAVNELRQDLGQDPYATVKDFAEDVEKQAEKSGKTKTAILTALETNPRIKVIVDRLKAEMVEDVDTEELLDGFLS